MNDRSKKLSTDDFDYELPEELIALEPAKHRDSSRLLVLSKSQQALTDKVFSDITEYLSPGDLLILNDTKVFPARLYANKESGGKLELLAERIRPDGVVKAQIKSNRTPSAGSKIRINDEISATIIGREDEFFLMKFSSEQSALEVFERYGHIPLPPYIDREDTEQDVSRYQTVFAQNPGAVAAPTAGLHFTNALLERLRSNGVNIGNITLHVGAGTFKPVKVDDPTQHKMHAEFTHVTEAVCERIKQTKQQGGRVIAVGTTCVRALESAAYNRSLSEFLGETEIFIYPGFEFKVVDALITNFHLPRSTLLMLISALAGEQKIKQAYQHAIQQRYRFYSYGDAMMIIN